MPLSTALEAALVILIGVSIIDLHYAVGKMHRSRLLKMPIPPQATDCELHKHLEAALRPRREKHDGHDVNEILVKDILRLLWCFERTYVWTGVLPFCCYCVAMLIQFGSASNLLLPNVRWDWLVAGMIGAAVVFQLLHRYLVWKTRIYRILYQWELAESDRDPVISWLLRRVRGS